MADTTYSIGTVTVANGGTVVTGVGTAWAGKVFAGDLFTDPAQGLIARVTADAVANDELQINAWPGTGLTSDAYELLFMSDSVRTSERTRQLLEQLSVVQANGRGLFYRFDDTVTDADPGAGLLRLNDLTIGSATAGYLDNLDADGASVSAVVDTWDDNPATGKGQLWLRSIADPSAFHAFEVTGAVVDGTGYRKLTLTYIGGSGSFADGDALMVMFSPAGQAGVDGPTGADGGITLTFDNPTAAADPGAGKFRLNHATHASATAIFIDNAEAFGGAIGGLVDTWDDSTATVKGTLQIVDQDAPANWRSYSVSAVADSAGYRAVTIAYLGGNGTLADEASCSLFFSRTGNNGADGTDGVDGFSPGYRLTFSTTTTDSDPGAGNVRFNHATFGSITYVYVDNSDAGAASITAWLDSLDDVSNANARAYLRFQKATDPTVYAEFAVVGSVVDGTGYRKIPVSPIVGAIPADATVLVASASKSGADGAASVPDQIRVNDAQVGFYQAKSQAGFTGYRRGKNTLWDGYADSSGVNAGRSANYSVETSAKCIKPTAVQTLISPSGKTKIGNMTGGGTLAAAFDAVTSQAQAASAQLNPSTNGFANTVGVDWGSGTTKTVTRFRVYGPSDNNILGSAGGTTLKLQGSTDNFSSSIVDLTSSQAFPTGSAQSLDVTSGITTTTAYRYHRVIITGNGTNTVAVAEVEFYEGSGVNNLTDSTTLQTADAAVTSVTAVFEIDPIDAVTLGTDLTVIATCNGWTNNGSATLTNMGKGQSGRTLVRAVATGLTSGTSFAAEAVFANNKNCLIYGIEVRAE